ncbi:MAG: preprotein translocase subunit YajC [Clostridia bacterium]|nr:preprotein translocase subunit YajC [Clostridia bacterium]
MLNSLLAIPSYANWIIIGVLVVGVIGLLVFSSRRRKKQEKDAQDLINAVQPGNKVKTIGGICGIVVEVDNEEQTFVLETGTEKSGKCFIKFDRQAIYQTDAVVSKDAAVETKTEEAAEPAAEVKEEVKTEEVAPVPAQTEEKAEEKVEEKPAKKTSGKAKKTDKE